MGGGDARLVADVGARLDRGQRQLSPDLVDNTIPAYDDALTLR